MESYDHSHSSIHTASHHITSDHIRSHHITCAHNLFHHHPNLQVMHQHQYEMVIIVIIQRVLHVANHPCIDVGGDENPSYKCTGQYDKSLAHVHDTSSIATTSHPSIHP